MSTRAVYRTAVPSAPRCRQPRHRAFTCALAAQTTLTLLALALLTACGPSRTGKQPQETSIQLQSFQAEEFATTKKIAFAATLSVFQDLGYTIGSADLETGLIAGKSPTEKKLMLSFLLGFGHKMLDTKATAFVEALGKNKARVRLNFVSSTETSTGYGIRTADDEPVTDPEVYQETFQRIRKAIFVRENTQ